RALEVHAPARLPLSHGSTRKRRRDGRRGEPVGPAPPDGEAGAVHGDTLAFDEIVIPAPDTELPPCRSRRYTLDRADVVDQSSEHYAAPSAKVVFKSSPNVTRSSTGNRASDAAVALETCAKAFKAVAPSTTGA